MEIPVRKVIVNGDEKIIGGDSFHGQWIDKSFTFFNNITLANDAVAEIDLKTVLPEDGYDYEIMVMAVGVTGATSGNSVGLQLFVGDSRDSYTMANEIIYIVTRQGATEHNTKSGTLIVPSPRKKLIVRNFGNAPATGIYVYLRGYRRLGMSTKTSTPCRGIITPQGEYIYTLQQGADFDGQWVSKALNLGSSITLTGGDMASGNYLEYDLSSYLPNDNHNYEVMMTGWGSTTSTNGHNTRVKVWPADINGNFTIDHYMFGQITRTASNRVSGGFVKVPICGKHKKVRISNSGTAAGNVNGLSINIRGYRRIGDNDDALKGNYFSSFPLSNGTVYFGGNLVDGPYVKKHVTLVNKATGLAKSMGAVTIDLGTYLPDNNHAYEIFGNAYIWTVSGTGGEGAEMYINGYGQNLMLVRMSTRNSTSCDRTMFSLPISKGRNYITIANSISDTVVSGEYSIYLRGYRRLGDNT